MKYVASCSGGKDSVAMVLELIEKEWPLDCVVMVDLGKEFDCIYRIWDRLCEFLDAHNISHAKLTLPQSFDYYFAEHEVKERKGGSHYKKQLLTKFYSELYGNEPICEYVGIAADETERVKVNRDKNIKYYPLVLWGMTENDCLVKCYRNGFNWKERSVDLYDVLERVSCYCCANKNLGECKAMIRYLPQYWQKIKDMETMIGKPFKDIGTAVIEGKINDGKNHPGTVFEDVPEQGQNLSS